MALLARETSADQALSEVRYGGDVNRLAVEVRAAAQFGDEHLVACGIVDYSGNSLTPAFDRQRNTKHRIAVRKIRCSVERVDIPLVLAAGFDARSLFTHYVVLWKMAANLFQNQRL